MHIFFFFHFFENIFIVLECTLYFETIRTSIHVFNLLHTKEYFLRSNKTFQNTFHKIRTHLLIITLKSVHVFRVTKKKKILFFEEHLLKCVNGPVNLCLFSVLQHDRESSKPYKIWFREKNIIKLVFIY